MAIQETKIDSSIATSELFPESCPYNVYRKDRNLHGGGVIRIKKIHASYTLEGTVLENVENIKYLGSLSQMIYDGIHMSAMFALRLIGPLAS